MSVSESKVVSLWEKTYKTNVEKKFLTALEAFSMMANELNIDYRIVMRILQKSRKLIA